MSLRIYFFLQNEKPGQGDVHALAESLALCGFKIYAPIDWWHESPAATQSLFVSDPRFDPRTADIVIVGRNSYRTFTPDYHVKIMGFPDWLTAKDRRFKLVYIEGDDSYEAHSFRAPFDSFDLILRIKFNKRVYNPPHYLPWPISVSQYVIDRADQKLLRQGKRMCILSNFNATHPFEHPLRKLARERIVPKFEKFLPIDRTMLLWDQAPTDPFDAFHLKQVPKYYNPAYHDLLAGAAACFAFCGDLIPGLPLNPAPMLRYGNKGKLKRKLWGTFSALIGSTPRSVQWDSYRFWECLAFGCCPIHIDLEKYGVDLPTMPKNWEHYVGLDLDNLGRDINRIRKSPDLLLKIGQQGREWLKKHYSGRALCSFLFEYLHETGSLGNQ